MRRCLQVASVLLVLLLATVTLAGELVNVKLHNHTTLTVRLMYTEDIANPETYKTLELGPCQSSTIQVELDREYYMEAVCEYGPMGRGKVTFPSEWESDEPRAITFGSMNPDFQCKGEEI